MMAMAIRISVWRRGRIDVIDDKHVDAGFSRLQRQTGILLENCAPVRQGIVVRCSVFVFVPGRKIKRQREIKAAEMPVASTTGTCSKGVLADAIAITAASSRIEIFV